MTLTLNIRQKIANSTKMKKFQAGNNFVQKRIFSIMFIYNVWFKLVAVCKIELITS